MNHSQEILNRIGSNIRRKRKALKITLLQLEAATGLDTAHLSRIERAVFPDLQISTIAKIATALQVDIQMLFEPI